MLKKQDRDNIRLRTLSFYQKEGEVYNELITVLINLRSNSNLRLSMSPAKVLNEASCICIDVSDLSEENMKKTQIINSIFLGVMLLMWGI